MKLSRPFTVGPKYLLPFICVAIFISQLGMSVSTLPGLKLMQDIICKKQSGIPTDPLLPEAQCHGDAVQRELNLVVTGITVSHTIGSAIVALPAGLLADRVGRVPMLSLSILSVVLSHAYALCIFLNWRTVPLRAIWGVGAISLLGGGRGVAEGITLTMISDIVSEEKRSVSLLCAVAAVIAAQIIAPIIAGRILLVSIWVPLWLSLALVTLGCLLIALFARETLPPRNNSGSEGPPDGRVRSMRHILRDVFSRPSILLYGAAISVIPVATTQSDILIRIMPIQFSWTLPHSALLLSLAGLVTLVTLLVLLPLASMQLRRIRHIIGHVPTDLILLRASALLFLFGSFCLTMVAHPGPMIAGLVITCLSVGTPTLARSLIVSLVSVKHEGKSDVGSLFAIMSLGEIVSSLVCQLCTGALLDLGLRSWIGLPLLFGMVIALAVCISVWVARLPISGADEPSEMAEPEMAETSSDTSTTVEGKKDAEVVSLTPANG